MFFDRRFLKDYADFTDFWVLGGIVTYLRGMDEDIELAIESADGTIDCRLEPKRNEDTDELYYSATILYPDMVSGFFRSEIYCYDLVRVGGKYVFAGELEDKIKVLEGKLGEAVRKGR